MLITRKMDYGLRIMMSLGLRAGDRVSGADLADAAEVSRGFALKIVRQLAQAGLVLARRGVGGGVDLARDPAQITLYEILDASGSVRPINQCIAEPRLCDRSNACAAHRLLRPIQEKIDHELKSITLADLVAKQRTLNATSQKA